MARLRERRIATLERRNAAELSLLIRRLGGEPVNAPAVREVPCQQDYRSFSDALTHGRASTVIVQTGAGITELLLEADRRGELPRLVEALRRTTIVCRGPKPILALKRYGLQPQFTTPKPHTSQELLRVLGHVDLAGGVVLVHYGERNVALADALRGRGVQPIEVCPYEWAMPEDVAPVQAVVRDLLADRLDAVLFTSQVQCRHLLAVADAMAVRTPLVEELSRDVVVGAIGPVCAATLREVGVVPDVMPASPSMTALVSALADYYELTDGVRAPR